MNAEMTLPGTLTGNQNAPANEAGTAVVNFDASALLSRVGGDRQSLRLVAEMFLQDCPRLLRGVQAALAAADAPGLHRAAHALRGAAATVGALVLRDQANVLESASGIPDMVAAQHAADMLEAQFTAFRHAVTHALETPL